MTPSTFTSVAQIGHAYRSAPDDRAKCEVLMRAIDCGFISRGDKIDIIKTICGEDLSEGCADDYGYVSYSVFFGRVLTAPADSAAGPAAPAVLGWRMGIETLEDGAIEYYYFTDLKRL